MVSVLIFGDLCPTKKNEAEFIEGRYDEIFGNVNSIMKESDLNIANLECPLTDSNYKPLKSGPNLKASKKAINALENARFDVLSMANNHIMDFDEDGLIDTIETCTNAKIDYLGAGLNEEKASKYLIKAVKDKKIGIIAFADNEFNIAIGDISGANGLDLLYSFDEIKKVKNECDYLIILYHSGLEHYEYPSPELQKRCRKMVEVGADLVTCQHSHIIGCNELYFGGTIVYGQGNFLFATSNVTNEWNTGLIISLNIDNNGNKIKYIPVKTTKDGNVSLLDENESGIVIKNFNDRSNKITDPNFVSKNFDEKCGEKEYVYWGILTGYPRIIFILNRLLKNAITKLIIRKRKALVIENIIRCETHNEVLRKVINKFSK